MRTSLARLDAAHMRGDELSAREAVAAAHAFNVAAVDERVATARKQIDSIGESVSTSQR
jgi:hypothetical protein